MCVKPVMEVQNNQYTFANLPRLLTTHAQPSNKGTLGRPNIKKHGTKITPKQIPAKIDKSKFDKTYPDCPITPRPKIQTSIKDFINKGKKRLNTVQLTAVENKKLNTRLIPTDRDKTVDMIREILSDIIYSEYPLKISPIFAHLKSKKPKNPKKPENEAPLKNLGKIKKQAGAELGQASTKLAS